VFYITVYDNKSTLELVVIQKDGVDRQILARQCSQDSQGLQANNAAIATGKGPYIIHLGPNSSPEYFEAWGDLQNVRIEQCVFPR
jgi:hypothetical protein